MKKRSLYEEEILVRRKDFCMKKRSLYEEEIYV